MRNWFRVRTTRLVVINRRQMLRGADVLGHVNHVSFTVRGRLECHGVGMSLNCANFMSCRAKLRLVGRQPCSWVARMTKRPSANRCLQERLRAGGSAFRSNPMSHYGIPDDRSCGSCRPGHQVHWITPRRPGRKINPDRRIDHVSWLWGVEIRGEELSLTLWTHEATRLRQAWDTYGHAVWKPRWHVLSLPGPSGVTFNMATWDRRTPCVEKVAPPPSYKPPSIVCCGRRGHTEATQCPYRACAPEMRSR